MATAIHKYNESFDLLSNGSVIEAVIKNYEIAWTFGDVIWFWPVIFLFTLVMVAMKSESPAFISIYAVLGNVFLGTMLPQISHLIFGLILVFSFLIVLYSLFASPRTE